MNQYKQSFGFWPGVLLVFAVVAIVVAAVFSPLALVGVIPVAWVAWTFSEFTVGVRSDGVEWFFRSGVWHKRVAYSDITQVKPVRNRWWYGWGLHWTPQGWLYNASGVAAVEIVTKAGHRYRLGADDPEALAAEINRHLALPRPRS